MFKNILLEKKDNSHFFLKNLAFFCLFIFSFHMRSQLYPLHNKFENGLPLILLMYKVWGRNNCKQTSQILNKPL